MKWKEMKWNEMKWKEMKWNEMKRKGGIDLQKNLLFGINLQYTC